MFSLTGIFLFAIWLSAVALSLYVVRDVFSPEKLVLVALGVFFWDIFIHDYSLEVSLTYALLLMSFITVVVAFVPILRRTRMGLLACTSGSTHCRNGVQLVNYKFFWLISLPALAAQVAMIQFFGGIEGYINILALRVVEFEGLGWLMSIIRTFSIVNLIYFSYLVTRRKRKTRDIAIYGLHLLLFVVLALLTGSRGSLLVNFVLMALIYHHSVHPVRARWLFILAVGALLVASGLEVARQGVAFGEEGLITGLSEEKGAEKQMSFTWAKYGTIPLELVLEVEQVNMYYGLTYLTVFTNIIPRFIWPTKPDAGGRILTKEYTGNAWGGTSYLSTGIIPEAIINFGQPLGLVVAFLQFGALVGGLLLYYLRYRRRLVSNAPYTFIYSVRFAYISWAMMAVITGEFTNVMVLLFVEITTVSTIHQLIRLFSNRRS